MNVNESEKDYVISETTSAFVEIIPEITPEVTESTSTVPDNISFSSLPLEILAAASAQLSNESLLINLTTTVDHLINSSVPASSNNTEEEGWSFWGPHSTNVSRGGAVIPTTTENDGLLSTNDASWVLTATFIIFTMQSGFGLLESGCVSVKNETNIMVKNVVDVVLGGFTYWLFGYGLSFGQSEWTNPFCGWGNFALNVPESDMGQVYTTFFFQLSFATTATTVVSGAIAERFNFVAYVIFSAVNTIVYCVPAGWLWGSHGFLFNLGVIDIAGSCGVHLCGGASAVVASYLVGPRLGRYDFGEEPIPMGNPTSAILGMFMLWWGWLGFNCGSTFGVDGKRWMYAARTAVTTLHSSIGGGLTGMSISWWKNRKLEITDVVNSILGALVGVTAGCALYTTWEALVVGMVGGAIAVLSMPLFDKLHIDDPVGAASVHGLCGIWAMIAIGLFVQADTILHMTGGRAGIFRGGGFYLLGVQILACICTIVWSTSVTFILLKIIDRFVIKIRMSEWEELVGADFAEHGIRRRGAGITRAVSVLGLEHNGFNYGEIPVQGDNPCHQSVLDRVQNLNSRRGSTVSTAVAQVTKVALANKKFKKGKRGGNFFLEAEQKEENRNSAWDQALNPIGSINNGWT